MAVKVVALAAGAILAGLLAPPASAQGVVGSVVAGSGAVPASAVFLNAKPRPLPLSRSAPRRESLAAGQRLTAPQGAAVPGRSAGSPGGAVQAAIQIVPDAAAGSTGGSGAGPAAGSTTGATPTPFAYGTGEIPFTISRAELNPAAAQTTNLYPFRAAGRLGFKIGGQNYICSAALIGPGLLLTAAHCVTDYGTGKVFPNGQWAFIPGYYKGKGAYGTFAAQAVFVPKSYLDGTEYCLEGVVCPNDVAVIVLKPDSKRRQAGNVVGWFGTGWDGWGFVEDQAQVTQLGYPAGIEGAAQMIRGDSAGYALDFDGVPNTVIGSAMNGGSSGGPWTANLGVVPTFTGAQPGQQATANTIIGVTSWGYVDGGVLAVQGASPFTSGNIVALRAAACGAYPSACPK